LPENCTAVIDENSWQWPTIFQWLQKQGNVKKSEMHRTFNCGVGMVLCVPAAQEAKCIELLNAAGETAWKLGQIETSQGQASVSFAKTSQTL
jgi:phosphoribosylformylglycinamidine cyclo-ligase